jgi:hypothetical protein
LAFRAWPMLKRHCTCSVRTLPNSIGCGPMTSLDLPTLTKAVTFARNGLSSRSTTINYTFPQQTSYTWESPKFAELAAGTKRGKVCAIDCNPFDASIIRANDCIENGTRTRGEVPPQIRIILQICESCDCVSALAVRKSAPHGMQHIASRIEAFSTLNAMQQRGSFRFRCLRV